jgi:hypothetical protein
MQEDLLRRAYQRSVHRNYIEGVLRRTGHTVIPTESANTASLRIRPTD